MYQLNCAQQGSIMSVLPDSSFNLTLHQMLLDYVYIIHRTFTIMLNSNIQCIIRKIQSCTKNSTSRITTMFKWYMVFYCTICHNLFFCLTQGCVIPFQYNQHTIGTHGPWYCVYVHNDLQRSCNDYMTRRCAIGNFSERTRVVADFCWNIQVHWGLILSGFQNGFSNFLTCSYET